MGLGLALTGFLTGFSERAAENIKQRNKDMREEMDDDIKNYLKTVQGEYKERRKLQAMAVANINELEAIFSEKDFKSFSKEQLAIIATNSDVMKQIREVQDDSKLMSRLKNNLKFSKPSGFQYATNDQAILAQLPAISMSPPRVTQTESAYGIPSDQQQKALDRAKKMYPEYFQETTTAIPGTATLGKLDTKKMSVPELTKNVEKSIDQYMETNLTEGYPGFIFETNPTTGKKSFKYDTRLGRTYTGAQASKLANITKLKGLENYIISKAGKEGSINENLAEVVLLNLNQMFATGNRKEQLQEMMKEGAFSNTNNPTEPILKILRDEINDRTNKLNTEVGKKTLRETLPDSPPDRTRTEILDALTRSDPGKLKELETEGYLVKDANGRYSFTNKFRQLP